MSSNLGQIKVDRILDGDEDGYTIHIKIPKGVVDDFSYGLIHSRLSHCIGTGLQGIQLERRAELLEERQRDKL